MSVTEFKVVGAVVLALLAAVGTFAFFWREAVGEARRLKMWHGLLSGDKERLQHEVAILKAQIAKVQRIFEGEGDS